jgi:hypothetical protein
MSRIRRGHVVVEALQLLRETHVLVVRLEHLNEDQLRFVQIALNKLAEGSTWELEELRVELGELHLAGYDLPTTGFTSPEIDIVLQPSTAGPPDDAEQLRELPTTGISEPGDLWLLGEHRLLCGDALEPQSYTSVLPSR